MGNLCGSSSDDDGYDDQPQTFSGNIVELSDYEDNQNDGGDSNTNVGGIHELSDGDDGDEERDVTYKDRRNETIIVEAGKVNGLVIYLDNLNNCDVFLLGWSGAVSIDDLKDCRVFIGPCASSVFIRQSKSTSFVVGCQQLRLRDCKRLQILGFISAGQPSIETSRDIRIGCFQYNYPGMASHFERSMLDHWTSAWSGVYDFNSDDSVTLGPGAVSDNQRQKSSGEGFGLSSGPVHSMRTSENKNWEFLSAHTAACDLLPALPQAYGKQSQSQDDSEQRNASGRLVHVRSNEDSDWRKAVQHWFTASDRVPAVCPVTFGCRPLNSVWAAEDLKLIETAFVALVAPRAESRSLASPGSRYDPLSVHWGVEAPDAVAFFLYSAMFGGLYVKEKAEDGSESKEQENKATGGDVLHQAYAAAQKDFEKVRELCGELELMRSHRHKFAMYTDSYATDVRKLDKSDRKAVREFFGGHNQHYAESKTSKAVQKFVTQCGLNSVKRKSTAQHQGGEVKFSTAGARWAHKLLHGGPGCDQDFDGDLSLSTYVKMSDDGGYDCSDLTDHEFAQIIEWTHRVKDHSVISWEVRGIKAIEQLQAVIEHPAWKRIGLGNIGEYVLIAPNESTAKRLCTQFFQ